MQGEIQPGMQCAEFDALLADALDGVLTGTDQERFHAHAALCPACGPLFSEAQAGFRLLHALEEVEPPPALVHNILASTTGRVEVVAAAHPVRESWGQKLRRWTQPVYGAFLQPRFAMSFGMAFFSVTLMLHVSGVKASDIRRLDLRPAAITKTYYETQGKLVKYYENIRVVYEIESRLQQLKSASDTNETPAAPQPKEEHKQQQKSEPDKSKDDRNYSRERNAITVAEDFHGGWPTDAFAGVGSELASRRLS